jgi:tetratricopeptide (TPR) repeat protein
MNLGLVRNRQGRYGDAVKVLSELVKDQPTLGQARILLAEGLIVSKQFDEAEQQLRTGLKDETLERSTRADGHLKLGRVFSSQGLYKNAAAEFEKAAELEPESASAQLYLGAVYVQLQKPAEAEPALQKAYALGGKRSASAQLLLGQLYYNQQKLEPALQAFEQFLADVPAGSNVPQIKSIVEKIKLALKK